MRARITTYRTQILYVTVGPQHPTGRYKCSRRNWNRVVELVGLGLAIYQRDNSSGALLGLLGQFYLYFGELARRPLCRLIPPGPFHKRHTVQIAPIFYQSGGLNN